MHILLTIVGAMIPALGLRWVIGRDRDPFARVLPVLLFLHVLLLTFAVMYLA